MKAKNDKTDVDIWSQWLLLTRHGSNPQQKEAVIKNLLPMRDKILDHAAINENDLVLDIGCGDGLIAFGVLEKYPTPRVIFSDISGDLLDHAKSLAQEMDLSHRCQFKKLPAENLFAINNESVDVVTVRSVLIYIAEKQAAFNEFFRVLRTGGRLSIFEPINRYAHEFQTKGHFIWGYDMTPVKDLAKKVNEVYAHYQLDEHDPMLDFGEYDLITFAERAGFPDIHLELSVNIQPYFESRDVETILQTAPNPKLPTHQEIFEQALSISEAERLISYLRNVIEVEKTPRPIRYAGAYLWAVK